MRYHHARQIPTTPRRQEARQNTQGEAQGQARQTGDQANNSQLTPAPGQGTARYDVHRTTVAAHLDRHQVPRHRKQTAWDIEAPGRQPSAT